MIATFWMFFVLSRKCLIYRCFLEKHDSEDLQNLARISSNGLLFGEDRYQHFAEVCEDRRGRCPLVFYGHDNEALAGQDYQGYALEVIERSRKSDRQLAYAYEKRAEHAHASDFDDRSVPFAVGSLSYSRSVNDVVRVWLTVWENAHGDMGRTPYRNASKTQPSGRS